MAFERLASRLNGSRCACQRRRLLLAAGAGYILPAVFPLAGWAQSREAAAITLSVPGPHGSVSYPLELAVKLGLDRDEGIALRLKFVGGGGVAIQDLESGNAAFAVFGLPAAMVANTAAQSNLVALAAIDDLPLYSLMVRQDLKGKVKRIADLKGMRIGIFSNALATKTTSHQILELLLQVHGISAADVSIVAAGQSWDTQSSAFIAGSVDASMCDEPFAARLGTEKLAFELFSTGVPGDARRVPGAGFLRAALIARRRQLDDEPLLAERVVKVVKRTLAWIASHSPEQFADALGMVDSERDAFLGVARKHPRQYSSDGRFSLRQLRETETFFHAGKAGFPQANGYRLDNMVVDRWAGSKP